MYLMSILGTTCYEGIYEGDQSYSALGEPCIPWKPLFYLYGDLGNVTAFPDASLDDAGNSCRYLT